MSGGPTLFGVHEMFRPFTVGSYSRQANRASCLVFLHSYQSHTEAPSPCVIVSELLLRSDVFGCFSVQP